jgi:sugar/nucleoside kinase (ribokinase family)
MSKSPSVDLVGVGLNATDTVIALSNFPVCGSKVEYRTEIVMPGGQVASTVVACQTWGMRTRYVGKVGDDDAGKLHASEFGRLGVDARLIHVSGASSPNSLILVDRQGERTVLCRRDKRLLLRPEELDRDWIVSARILHVDGYDTAAATVAAGWARAAGIPVVADLDETYPGVEELIRNIDYLIVSRDFPCRLMSESDLKKALHKMQLRYGCRLTAATLGSGGTLACDGNRFCYRPAYRVPVVDTTGAGDIFHAGFIYGLLQGWALERQLDFSCAAAAMNCMADGARGGIRSVEAIEGLMASEPRSENTFELSDRDGLVIVGPLHEGVAVVVP